MNELLSEGSWPSHKLSLTVVRPISYPTHLCLCFARPVYDAAHATTSGNVDKTHNTCMILKIILCKMKKVERRVKSRGSVSNVDTNWRWRRSETRQKLRWRVPPILRLLSVELIKNLAAASDGFPTRCAVLPRRRRRRAQQALQSPGDQAETKPTVETSEALGSRRRRNINLTYKKQLIDFHSSNRLLRSSISIFAGDAHSTAEHGVAIISNLATINSKTSV